METKLNKLNKLTELNKLNKLTELTEYISAHSKEFEIISQKKDIDVEMINNALKIVHQFIIDKQLILYGGLAIDYALRIKGDKIYNEEDRPDFDVLSSDSVNDAYQIADILYNHGFESVQVIKALHIQTMKVRINFIFVLDISYIPIAVFKTLPFLIYKGIKIIHPDFQRMDMHLSLSFPFNGTPREQLFNRWEKDIKRFALLNKYYPIGTNNTINNKIELKTYTFNLNKYNLFYSKNIDIKQHKRVNPTISFHGFAAYAIMRKSLDQIIKLLNVKIDEKKLELNAPTLELKFLNKYTFTLQSPINVCYFACSTIDEIIDNFKNIKIYYPYLDINLTQIVTDKNITFLSVEKKILSISKVNIKWAFNDNDNDNDNKYINTVSCQFLLLYFLFQAHINTAEIKNMYQSYYNSVLYMINIASEIFQKLEENDNDNNIYAKLFINSVFGPSIKPFGDINIDTSYIIAMVKTITDLNDEKNIPHFLKKQFGKIDFKSILNGLPKSYYPNGTKKKPHFNYEESVFFKRDGREIKEDDEKEIKEDDEKEIKEDVKDGKKDGEDGKKDGKKDGEDGKKNGEDGKKNGKDGKDDEDDEKDGKKNESKLQKIKKLKVMYSKIQIF